MKRLLIFLTLLTSCSGCAMFDDWIYDDSPGYVQTQAPPNSCGLTPASYLPAQTVEPPR